MGAGGTGVLRGVPPEPGCPGLRPGVPQKELPQFCCCSILHAAARITACRVPLDNCTATTLLTVPLDRLFSGRLHAASRLTLREGPQRVSSLVFRW